MDRWQIVIPMSGFGERFRRAGYTVPKPLIEVTGKPIIAHVLDLFKGETDVHFICNRDHLAHPDWRMAETLRRYCPTGRIHPINPHKFGPVYAVSCILDAISPYRPVAVNYCDFAGRWDFEACKHLMADTGCAGAVVCYTGFHPHMLACTKFAYCKTDDNDRVVAIQEKQSYTDSPMQEWASCGTYCFATGAILRQCFEQTIAREDLRLNGEYYASLAYRPLLEQGRDVRVFPISRFCQWGTPEDLREWKSQTEAVRLDAMPQKRPTLPGTTMIPMAGLGSRFNNAGYALPKPLIEVRGKPMVLAAWEDLPQTPNNVFILRADMPGAQDVVTRFRREVPGCRLILAEQVTDGQARTCLLGLKGVIPNAPLTIASCDNGLRYDGDRFAALWAENPDVIVWTMRGYSGAIRNPRMYGWVDADEHGKVRAVSVKQPMSTPCSDPIVTGAFTFRRAADFERAALRMISRNGRVNEEFYVDECINDAVDLGLDVRLFDVNAYLCWGTPDDLRTWEYWTDYLRGQV